MGCHLEGQYHKGESDSLSNTDHPDYEPENFGECHPWSQRSCCHGDDKGPVSTHGTIKESYGKEWHWDRCGPLSQACERFFVQEACFYECDPNMGFYRRFPNGGAPSAVNGTVFDEERYTDGEHNKWEVFGMPIKASFCDSWHQACSADMFCSSDSGNFFSCAAEYVELDKTQTVIVTEETEPWILVVLISGIVLVLGCILVLVYREKKGKPMFFS